MESDPPVFGVAPDFASVSAGGAHTCAQRVLGEPGVECWGSVRGRDPRQELVLTEDCVSECFRW